MPELPEVETVRRGLAPALEGASLVRADQRRPDLRFPFPDRFVERLTGARVEAVERRAKYLLARLHTGETWVTHLGMTGRFLVERGDGPEAPGRFALPASAEDRHAHLSVETDGGARVTYFDAHRFGYMGLIPTETLGAHPWFAGLGPEPLGPEFDPESLARSLHDRSQNIKATLLDQRIVAGLGNIYVCEALHRARISPLKAAGRVSRPALERLTGAVREVLEEAIAAGGSTLRDFAHSDGALGYFQHGFQAYGQEGKTCARADGGTIRRIVQGGRSTFFCPRCQR